MRLSYSCQAPQCRAAKAELHARPSKPVDMTFSFTGYLLRIALAIMTLFTIQEASWKRQVGKW